MYAQTTVITVYRSTGSDGYPPGSWGYCIQIVRADGSTSTTQEGGYTLATAAEYQACRAVRELLS